MVASQQLTPLAETPERKACYFFCEGIPAFCNFLRKFFSASQDTFFKQSKGYQNCYIQRKINFNFI